MPTEIHDCYRILELLPGAAVDEIKEAYVDLVKVWHPDRYQHENARLRQRAEEKIREINQAYAHLLQYVSSGTPVRVESSNGHSAVQVNDEPVGGLSGDSLKPRYFGGLWGYVNDTGRVMILPKFLYAEPFRSGLACVQLSKPGGATQSGAPGELPAGRYGFIFPSGEFAIAAQFERARGFYEDMAAVRLNGKWGFILLGGEFAIAPAFEEARSFRQRVAAVKLNGLWGFIGKSGEVTITPQFEQVDDFNGGWALVKMPGARDRLKINYRGELYVE